MLLSCDVLYVTIEYYKWLSIYLFILHIRDRTVSRQTWCKQQSTHGCMWRHLQYIQCLCENRTLQYMSVTPPPDREPTVDSGSFGREVEVCGGHCRKRTLLFCARPIFQSAIVFRLCYFRNLAQREARRSKERLLLKPDDDSTREKVTAAPLTKTQPGFFFWPFILDINSIFWFAGELFDSWTF